MLFYGLSPPPQNGICLSSLLLFVPNLWFGTKSKRDDRDKIKGEKDMKAKYSNKVLNFVKKLIDFKK